MGLNAELLKREWIKTGGQLLAALHSNPPRPQAVVYLRLRKDVAFRAWKRAKEAEEADKRRRA